MWIQYAGYFLIAVLLLVFVIKFFAWPIKILTKLLINGVLGVVLLFIVNLIGINFGFFIGINIWTALIAGLFGIPGVLFLIVFKLFL